MAVDVERSLAMLASRIGEYCRSGPSDPVVVVKN
jgi:hypothetical protein